MSLYKKLLAGVAATAAFILPGDFSAKKPEAPTAQNGLEQRISDNITETEVPKQFKPLTPADENTLSMLELFVPQYHSELDKKLEKGIINAEESSELLRMQVLAPVLGFILEKNTELYKYMTGKAGKTVFEGDEFLKYLEEYFLERGYSCIHQCKKTEYGTTHSIRAARILKTAIVDGILWGNKVNGTIQYLDEPRVQEYVATKRSKEKRLFSAENRNDLIYIFANSNEFVIDKLSEEVKWHHIKEPTTREEFLKILIAKGLQNESRPVEKMKKLDLIHEAMHIIYKKTHKYPVESDIYKRNMDELSSFLTELRNENTDFIYFKLGTIFNSLSIEYAGANKILFDYFLTEIEGNRQEYKNVDFALFDKTQEIEDLLMQLPKLTASQIRNLAEKCFNRHFPELNKAYNPADK